MTESISTLNVPISDSTTVTGPSLIESSGASMIINNLIENTNINLVSKFHLEKYLTFVNDKDVKQVVIMLTNNSSAVQDIVNMVNIILTDGKIDMKDGPILLSLIKKIIGLRISDLNLSKNLTLDHYLDILKLVLTILAKEGVIKVNNQDEFIADISKLIDLIVVGEKIVGSMSCSCLGKK